MKQSMAIKRDFRTAKGKLSVKHAKVNNLRDVSVDIPMGVLTVVTGVAGSGKSSLINEMFLSQHPEAIVIDQAAVGVSTRSNPATYTGIMDDVRKAFASTNKVSASLFSFNSKGACENCQGLGVIYTELAALGEVKTPCEVCGGKRFKDEVLGYKLNGKSISDVLAMTVGQALDFFEVKEVVRKLQAMSDVGLDYLTLGQPLSTLIGRGMPAHQAGQRTAQKGQHLRDGRADHRAAYVGHQPFAEHHEPAGRCQEHGDRDRA